MLEHVAYGGLAFEVVEAEAGTRREFGNVDDFDGELLAGLPMDASPHQREGSFA